MAKRAVPATATDEEIRVLLERCPVPFHEVRARFLGNIATPRATSYKPEIRHPDASSLTSLKEKLIKTGAKVVSHGRYVAFQTAEVAECRRTGIEQYYRRVSETRRLISDAAFPNRNQGRNNYRYQP